MPKRRPVQNAGYLFQIVLAGVRNANVRADGEGSLSWVGLGALMQGNGRDASQYTKRMPIIGALVSSSASGSRTHTTCAGT